MTMTTTTAATAANDDDDDNTTVDQAAAACAPNKNNNNNNNNYKDQQDKEEIIDNRHEQHQSPCHIQSPSTSSLEEVFQAVLTWIQQQKQQSSSSSSTLSFSLSTFDKLRLYGLYKHITTTTTDNNDNNVHDNNDGCNVHEHSSSSSSLNTTSGSGGSGSNFWNSISSLNVLKNVMENNAKQEAWIKCQHLSRNDAILAYIDLFYNKILLSVISMTLTTDDSSSFYLQQQIQTVLLQQRSHDDLNNHVNDNNTANAMATTTTTTTANSCKTTTITKRTNQNMHHHHHHHLENDPSSNDDVITADAADDNDDGGGNGYIFSRFLYKVITLLQFRHYRLALIPRGQVDISYSLLFYALYITLYHYVVSCFIGGGGGSVNSSSNSQSYYEAKIVTLWKHALKKQQEQQQENDDDDKSGARVETMKVNHDVQEAAAAAATAEAAAAAAAANEKTTTANNNNNNKDMAPAAPDRHDINKDEEQPNVLVGLAVRSLLDLYLTSQQYPSKSQIIISPPLNVPGMMQVMYRHNIDVVPIDLPSPSTTLATDYNDNDNDNDIIAVDVSAIERAITNKTVAILIVHAFGIITTTANDMQQLRVLANQHALHLLEDCAECYSGLYTATSTVMSRYPTPVLPFLGSRHADISFFSFGLLKTSTALGGGIAVVRSHHGRHHHHGNRATGFNRSDDDDSTNLAANMQRLQQSILYQNQDNLQYLQTVLKAFILKWIADCPVIHGVIYYLLSNSIMSLLYGPDCFDRLATWLLQGFKNNASSALSSSPNHVMAQIRQRPCPALLAALYRSLRQTSSAQVVINRIETCRRFTHAIGCLQENYHNQNNSNKKAYRLVTVPMAQQGCQHLYWLYPIRTSAPHELRQRALEAGFDVVTAASHGHGGSSSSRISSQLQCVSANPEAECPRTLELMRQVVYLPIASRNDLSLSELKRLQRVVALPPPDATATDTTTSGNNTSLMEMFLFLLPLLIAVLCLVPFSFIMHVVVIGIHVLSCTIAVLILAVYIIRWAAACLYVESATCFVQHCKLVQDMTLKRLINHENNNNNNNNEHTLKKACANTDQRESNKSVFESCSVENKGPERGDGPSSSIFDTMKVLAIPPTQNTATISRKVILTGSTGFVGSMLLRDLLWHRKSLSISRILVLCRSKRGDAAAARISSMLAGSMFSFLSSDEKDSLVEVLEGDMSKVNVGLSDSEIERLVQDDGITHVFHCAAAVSFTQSLEDAARDNISSALRMQALTACLASAVFVHISTAFVHGGRTGTEVEPLPEKLFPLGPYDALEIYKSMQGTQFYASKAMRDLGFPNTYTLSKSVCEHLLLRSKTTKTLMIRPSIVGPALEHPWEGWAGCKPSTVVAAACLYLYFPYNLYCLGSPNAPCIPVDIVSRYIIAKAFGHGSDKTDDYNVTALSRTLSPPELIAHSETPSSLVLTETNDSEKLTLESWSVPSDSMSDTWSMASESTTSRDTKQDQSLSISHTIHTAAWDQQSSPRAMFSWIEYGQSVVHMGSVLGIISHPTSYITWFMFKRVLPHLRLTHEQFELLHATLIMFPFWTTMWFLDLLGVDSSRMKKLGVFLDLPVLFFRFMNQSFTFTSELVAPHHLDGDRYMVTCATAAHIFVNETRSNRKEHTTESGGPFERGLSIATLSIAGRRHRPSRSDLWWTLTQPRGNVMVRFVAWALVKVLRMTCDDVTVDLTSFSESLLALKSMGDKRRILLAPTHRSFFDFLLLSFLFFAVPELQIQLPFIATADDFKRLPVIGWVIRFLGAIFVKRGRGCADPDLSESFRRIFNSCSSHGTTPVLEVFIEGQRSRDRRFVEPKTGLLRWLCEDEFEYLVIPITINYERIPEQEALTAEASGGMAAGLNLNGMLSWLTDAFMGRIDLGRVHLASGSPLRLNDYQSNDCRKLVIDIQRRQGTQMVMSKYHIGAAAKLFRMDTSTAEAAFSELGVRPWPGRGTFTTPLFFPSDDSELWTIVLQGSQWLEPVFRLTHPTWATWLSTHQSATLLVIDDISPEVLILVKSIQAAFDITDHYVASAVKVLKVKGFENPEASHVLQAALKCQNAPPAILLWASISFRLTSGRSRLVESTPNQECLVSPTDCVLESEERLGFWGFHDSSFYVKMGMDGSPCALMKGDRYSLCGKELKKLMPFIESEIQVKAKPSVEAFKALDVASLRASPSTLTTALVDMLKRATSKVSLLDVDRIRHGTGQNVADVYRIRSGQMMRVPDAVVWPSSDHEVEALVELAKKQGWCLVPFGGGTNVSQALSCPSLEIEPRPIISLDMKNMCQILWLHEENGLVHVQAGITGRTLLAEMERRGYTVGHEPDSLEFSTLGGWIATKASGMKRSKYGNIEDIIKAVTVVGTTGILHHGQTDSMWGRESSGTDLPSLLLGSEGNLGIITSAVLRINPLPEARDYDSVLLRNFEEGIKFTRQVSRFGSSCPASCRLLDNEHFRLGKALHPGNVSLVELAQNSLLMARALYRGSFHQHEVVCVTISYEGSKNEVDAQKHAIHRLVLDLDGIHLGPRHGKAGYEMTFLIAYLRDFALNYHYIGDSFETFAPWSKLASIIKATKDRIRHEHEKRLIPGIPFIGCRVTQLYHEGACVYFYLCMSSENVPNACDVFAEIEHAARSEILRQGGSLSHHHGVGKVRAPFLSSINSPAFQNTMLAIKRGMDPDNIFGIRNGQCCGVSLDRPVS